MCFEFLYKFFSETVFILRRNERDMIKKVYWSSLKILSILARFQWNLYFLKILKYQNSLISIQWEPRCSMRTDGRTDMRKLIVSFHNFANAPNKLPSNGNKFYIRNNIIFWWKQGHNFKQKLRRFNFSPKFICFIRLNGLLLIS